MKKVIRYYKQDGRLIKLKNNISCYIDDKLIYYKIFEYGYKSKKEGYKKIKLIIEF